MAEEIIDIVNENDEVIGTASRREAHEKGLLHRVVHVVIENSKGEVLCLRRELNVEVRPGFISNCAEHVAAGETYEKAASRATKEELGISAKAIFSGKIILYDEKNHNTITGCFNAKSDGPFEIDRAEFQGAYFKSKKQISMEISKGEKYSPAFIKVFENLYGKKGKSKPQQKSATVSAPGKLMLSGEWSVLENGVPCIVLAVNKRVYATTKESSEPRVVLKDFGIDTKYALRGISVSFQKDDERLAFTKHSIETALKYIQAKGLRVRTFDLETKSDISAVEFNGKKMKLGFGSSAAAVVAIIGAILRLHSINIETETGREKLFKLATIAHYYAQGKIGSGFDIAASTFGGALMYRRFDAEWLQQELAIKTIVEITGEKWPGFQHKNISLPKEFELCVGFTGRSASTRILVKKMKDYRLHYPEAYMKTINSIRDITENLAEALESGDTKKICLLLDANRLLLQRLSEESQSGLEIPEHGKMSEIAARFGAVAKFSGAGGGDCSIAVCFDKKTAEKINAEWKNAGMVPIGVEISASGAKAE